MLREAIHTILSTITVNNYPLQVPQRFDRSQDHIVYHIRNIEPENAKDQARARIFPALIVDIYSPSMEDAETLANQVADTLEAISGVYNGVDIKRILFDGESDDYEEEVNLNRIYQEYTIRV